MVIDVHCHYTLTRRGASDGPRFSFEPAFENGRRTLDSCVSPRILDSWPWRLMRRMMRIPVVLAPGDELDAEVERFYERHLLANGSIERYVLLAFDWYHDRAGRRPPLPRRRADRGSDIYTSNSLVRELCRRHPQRFLFGASIHPYRENAVECIDEVFAAGACLLKWLPLHQNIDVRDPRTLAVLRRCAELGLPILAHHGEEFTLTTQHPEHLPLAPLLDVLRALRREGRMPTVIIAHVSTPVTPFGERRSHRLLTEALLGEFADAPLYADISALTAWGKVAWLRRVARRQELHPKLLFGTDFPVPVALPRLRGDLGRAYARIRGLVSWPHQVAETCRHVGFNEIVFHRAGHVLANLDHASTIGARA